MHIDLATQDIHTLARNAVAAGASLVAEFDDLYVLRSPERHGAITVDSAAHSTSLRDPAGGTYLLTDRDPLAAA